MTVSTTHSENKFTGDGTTTVFNFTFRCKATAPAIEVLLNNAIQPSGYSVSANSDQLTSPGGTVTLDSAPALGAEVIARRNTTEVQDVTFPLEAKLNSAALEENFDSLVMMIQEARRDIDSKTFTWQGTWSAAVHYNVGDAVSNGTSSYIAIAANTNSSPPSANWDLLVTGPGSEGPAGAKGDTGATGPAGLIWRGAWNSGYVYAVNDAVESGGSAYIATAANTNSLPPSANWNLLASRGAGSAGGPGDIPYYSALNTLSNLVVGGDSQGLMVNPAGLPFYQDVISPSLNEFRLTASATDPLPTTDITGATTLYALPYRGNRIALYNGSRWVLRTAASMSIAVPAGFFRIYDVYGYDNTGTPTLELEPWDATQVTGTITGISAATSAVVTANNTLSVGDMVGIAGVTGTIGTDATRGLNGEVFYVSAVTGTTFTLNAIDTTGLAYTSGGTFYKLPTARNKDLVRQNGIYCKTAALTRRWMGSIMVVGASGGTIEDAYNSRLVINAKDTAEDGALFTADSTSHSYAVNSARPFNNAKRTARVRFLQVLPENLISTISKVKVTNSASAAGTAGTALNNLAGALSTSYLNIASAEHNASLVSSFVDTVGYKELVSTEYCSTANTVTFASMQLRGVIKR